MDEREVDDHAIAHTMRFRHVGTAYPNAVALAYDGDLVRALADDPETVAANVADWERSQGRAPRSWAELDWNEDHPGHDPGPGNWLAKAHRSSWQLFKSSRVTFVLRAAQFRWQNFRTGAEP